MSAEAWSDVQIHRPPGPSIIAPTPQRHRLAREAAWC